MKARAGKANLLLPDSTTNSYWLGQQASDSKPLSVFGLFFLLCVANRFMIIRRVVDEVGKSAYPNIFKVLL